jgi:hypothetical protein
VLFLTVWRTNLFYESLGDDGEVEIELPVRDLDVVNVETLPEQGLELLLPLLHNNRSAVS